MTDEAHDEIQDFTLDREFILDQLKVEKNFTLGSYAVESLTIERYHDTLTNRIIYSIRALIPAENMKEDTYTVSVRYPDGWWNAFKDRYFTPWLLRRFPVEYITKKETVRFTAYNMYPKFPEVYPNCGDARQVIVQTKGKL